MYVIDSYINSPQKCIDDKWVIARPENYKFRSIKQRIKEAWAVFTGKAEAVTFYKQ